MAFARSFKVLWSLNMGHSSLRESGCNFSTAKTRIFFLFMTSTEHTKVNFSHWEALFIEGCLGFSSHVVTVPGVCAWAYWARASDYPHSKEWLATSGIMPLPLGSKGKHFFTLLSRHLNSERCTRAEFLMVGNKIWSSNSEISTLGTHLALGSPVFSSRRAVRDYGKFPSNNTCSKQKTWRIQNGKRPFSNSHKTRNTCKL